MSDPKLDSLIALGARDGLPDALRILLEKHPRSEWTAPGRIGPLAAFWLERHMMFRKLIAKLTDASQSFLDQKLEARAFAQTTARFGQMFAGELHGHHHIEDAQYFPALREREERLVRAFDILDADHHALDGHLSAFVDASNVVLQAHRSNERTVDAAAEYLAMLQRFEPFLERHLIDEEDVIVPILLEHGEEWLG